MLFENKKWNKTSWNTRLIIYIVVHKHIQKRYSISNVQRNSFWKAPIIHYSINTWQTYPCEASDRKYTTKLALDTWNMYLETIEMKWGIREQNIWHAKTVQTTVKRCSDSMSSTPKLPIDIIRNGKCINSKGMPIYFNGVHHLNQTWGHQEETNRLTLKMSVQIPMPP